MLNPMRIALLVFVALVLLLLVSAMPGETAAQKRQRNISYMLVCLAYAALVLLYLKLFD
ncbi:MAG: hypothetical protein R3F46_04525 [bacterium]|nr:hypothetical protein [bacterium]